MPPRKRGRPTRVPSSLPEDEDAMVPVSPEVVPSMSEEEERADDPIKDVWTDEQEISLLKGIIKWKPAGMHKHFRMLALAGYLRNHGYDPFVEEHTSIPRIWDKLKTLYNLEAIDEQEDGFDYAEGHRYEDIYKEFSLPLNEFGFDMMERGRDKNGSETPPAQERTLDEVREDLPTRKRKRGDTVSRARASTVEDTDDQKSSPAPSSAIRSTRRGRRGRSTAQTKPESRERQPSRATTVEETDDADDDEVEDAAAEEGDEDEDEVEEGDGTPSPKVSRSTRAKEAKGAGVRAQSKPRKSTRRR